MKIYTVQHDDFLDREYDDGTLAPIFHPETSIFHEKNTCDALNWMKTEYDKRIPSDFYTDLIWVWPRLKWAFPGLTSDNMSIFVFEVPVDFYKNNILWSDFIDWHMVLNQIEDYNYDEIFNINLKKSKFPIQGVLSGLKKEWLVKKIKNNKEK